MSAYEISIGSGGDSASSSPAPDAELSKQDKESVKTLVAGMLCVVSYRCAVDENHDLLRSLELYNKAYWDKLGTQKDSLPNDPEHIRRQRVKKREKERRKQDLKQKMKAQEVATQQDGVRRRVPASAPATPVSDAHSSVDIAPIEIEQATPNGRPHSGGLPRIGSNKDLDGSLRSGPVDSPSQQATGLESDMNDLELDPYAKRDGAANNASVALINGRPPKGLKSGSRRNLVEGEGTPAGGWTGDEASPPQAKTGTTIPSRPRRQGSFPRKVSATWKNSTVSSTSRTGGSSGNGSNTPTEPPAFSFANPLPVSTGNPNGNVFAKKLSDMAYLTTETKRIEKKRQKQSERNSLSTSFEKILAAARAKNNTSRDASSRWNV